MHELTAIKGGMCGSYVLHHTGVVSDSSNFCEHYLVFFPAIPLLWTSEDVCLGF